MADNVDAVTVPADLKLGFVGAGKMAQAIIKGVLKSGLVPPEQIMGSARSDATRNKIKEIGVRVGTSNEEVAKFCDILIIGVKPPQICDVLQTFPFLTSSTLVVSIAAGVTCACIAESLPAGVRVFRVMPNLPVELGMGTCELTLGPNATPSDMALLEKLFTPCGFIEHLPESYFDITSSLLTPMYGCVAIEAMSDGCVKMGLPRALALRLCAQSLLGAAKLCLESGKHPAVIKDEVCSPGGTTIAAVHHLEKNHFRSALIGAIETQTLRAQELGRMAAEAQRKK